MISTPDHAFLKDPVVPANNKSHMLGENEWCNIMDRNHFFANTGQGTKTIGGEKDVGIISLQPAVDADGTPPGNREAMCRYRFDDVGVEILCIESHLGLSIEE